MSTPTPPLSRGDWNDATQQWFTACRSGFDTWLALCNATLAGADRMRMAQLEAGVETQTRNRSAALAAGDCRDMGALLALQSNLATAYLESAMRCSKSLADLAQQTNAEIARVLAARCDEWGRLMGVALPAAGAPEAMQQPFVIAFEAARASQEAMIRSFASLTSLTVDAQKRAA
jgi:hypothetical protein